MYFSLDISPEDRDGTDEASTWSKINFELDRKLSVGFTSTSHLFPPSPNLRCFRLSLHPEER